MRINILLRAMSSLIFSMISVIEMPLAVTGQSGCFIQNTEFPMNDYFRYTDGCLRYYCYCATNNQYSCPDVLVENFCSRLEQTTIPTRRRPTRATRRPTRRSTRVPTHPTPRPTPQRLTRGPTRPTPRRPVVVLPDQNQMEITQIYPAGNVLSSDAVPTLCNECHNCTVMGVIYVGHSLFTYDEGCFQINCLCFCNGTHTCPQRLNMCGSPERIIPVTRRPTPVTTLPIPTRSRTVTSPDISRRPCSSCIENGIRYQAYQSFNRQVGCQQYFCVCQCDGVTRCPENQARNTCSGGGRGRQCRECVVGSRKYPGRQPFQYREGCLEYNCDCSCNGAWHCPLERTVNVCADSDRPSGCERCIVTGGVEHAGNTRFTFEEGCLRFQCVCNCDGSWSCPATSTTNTCPANPNVCYNCVIYGRQIAGGERFEIRDGCLEKHCHCNCDGAYYCPDNETQNVCTGRQQRGCNVNGQIYPAGAFTYQEGCRRHDCVCSSDSRHHCPRITRIC